LEQSRNNLTLVPSQARRRLFQPHVKVEPLRDEDNSEQETGRGLQIVDTITDAWGVTPHVIGKAVWAEFALDDEVLGAVRSELTSSVSMSDILAEPRGKDEDGER
jgi:hypothetical protein